VRSRYPWALLLAALTLLVYAQTWRHGFVIIDDGTYVYNNPWVRQGLTIEGVSWAFTTFHASNWHPLTWLSHMLDVELFGLNAGGHHLVGALLHASSAALLLIFLQRATGSTWRSLFVAAVFALHPLRVESVAWVAERKDQLAALFWMLTLLAWLRYARRPGVERYAIVVVTLAIGLLAKPMLVTLPVILLLLDYWPLGRQALGWRRLAAEKVPLLALCVLSAAMTMLAQSAGGAVRSIEGYPPLARLSNAAVSCFEYPWQTLWPVHLAVHYPHPGEASVRGAIAAAALVVVTVALALRARRTPVLLVGWLWYLVALLPVLGIVQVGTQAHADRYTCLPTIGVYLMVAWGVGAVVDRRPALQRWSTMAAILVVAACISLSWIQIRHWRDNVSLFAHAVRVEPRSALSRLNYGVALLDAGRPGEAEQQLRVSIDLEPRNPLAYFNLGNLRKQTGDPVAAEASYRESLRLDPDLAAAHLNLGLVLLERGETRQAAEHLLRAEQLAPVSVEAKVNAANILALEGDGESAGRLYEQALRLDPGSAPARLGLARHRLETGRNDEAMTLLDSLIEQQPDLAAAHLLRGMELERRGRLGEAEAAYREVLRIDPGNRSARRRLGLGP